MPIVSRFWSEPVSRRGSVRYEEGMGLWIRSVAAASGLMVMLGVGGCTQELQNQFGRSVQNWTGTDGVLDIYAGEKLVKRFLKIDKLSTARGTGDGMPRSYRYGYGYHDSNLNMKVDPGEKKVYFEFSDYSTSYVFYEKP